MVQNSNDLKGWGKIFSVTLPFSCYFILDMPLIGSLIRILQYMEGCGKRSVDNSKESEQQETGRADLNEEDFHLKILKDICCELLSNMLQELTKVRINKILRGISAGRVRILMWAFFCASEVAYWKFISKSI